MRTVKYTITVETTDGESIYLPPYRFEPDAKLAASQLIEIPEVERAVVREIVIEQ